MKLTIGALAHVDAGKTTLSESILYLSNSIRNKGRVDNADAFLDYNELEKEKGITIYNKQALFSYKGKEYVYLDTPGHSDLAYEANRAIAILDVAILIVSANRSIPSDTIKQFNNLKQYNIPVLIFVNKMDITTFTKEEILTNIKKVFGDDCVEYSKIEETVSLESEELMNYYLENGKLDDNAVQEALKNGHVYPCFFGSALKDEGVVELLDFINRYINVEESNDELNAYIFKQSNGFTYLKVLSGTLLNKSSFGEYKINEMYEVSGDSFTPIKEAYCGDVVAIKGLKDIPIGTYLPSFNSDFLLEVPSLTYRILSSLDANELYKKLEAIVIEYPELKIELSGNNVFINLNGELHSLVIKRLIKERFSIDVEFSDPIIKYKETIKNESFGVGHFEPLRHYAEVVVKIKPANGFKVTSFIDNHYTNSLVSFLKAYPIRGILTNSILTNVEIDIVDIKTHPKHTEGQDLINALRRAIRHALTKNSSVILEPCYIVTIDTNEENRNTIISELTTLMFPFDIEEKAIVASIPLKMLNSALMNLKTKLKGNISYSIDELEYLEANNQEEIVLERKYDYRSDMRNPAGSIFCKNGAGHYAEPEEVEDMMHLNMSDYTGKESTVLTYNKSHISDEELKRVYNSIYKPKERYLPKNNKTNEERPYKPLLTKPLIYLIDGYNLMYYMNEELAINDFNDARDKVTNIVCDFAGYVNAECILIFDAYNNSDLISRINKYDNITIVYTKVKQTADEYIERKSKELSNDYKVIVVTSDYLEQIRVFANGASRLSSREFVDRYNRFKKNNKKIESKPNKPLAELKELLIENDED